MKLITKTDELAEFCKPLADAQFVTVDTEFMRERTYWPKLCLAQVAGPHDAAAIDALAERFDMTPSAMARMAGTSMIPCLAGPASIAATSSAGRMPAAPSIATCASEPRISWGARRLSNPMEALISSMMSPGPVD